MLASLLLQVAVTSLSVDRAIEYAVAHRGTISVAAAATREARALRRLAGQLPNPFVSYSHSEDPPRQHFTVEQPFSWLALRRNQVGAAATAIRRAEFDSLLTVAGTVQEVRSTFYGALGAAAGYRFASDLGLVADSLVRVARRRFDAGDIALLEVEQLEQDARRQAQSVSEARQSRSEAIAGLLAAIGWAAGTAPTPEGRLDTGLDDSLPAPPPVLPEVEVALADSVIGASQIRLARRGALPIPNITLGANWDDPSNPGKTLRMFGLAMPLPLWHRNGGEIAVAEAAAARAAAQLAEARLTSTRLLAETRIRFEATAARARFARDSLLPAAQRLRARAVQAYQAGETGVLPVLEALRSEREVSLAAVRDLILFQETRAMWLALLGRLQ